MLTVADTAYAIPVVRAEDDAPLRAAPSRAVRQPWPALGARIVSRMATSSLMRSSGMPG
jgi:hypothetical protein